MRLNCTVHDDVPALYRHCTGTVPVPHAAGPRPHRASQAWLPRWGDCARLGVVTATRDLARDGRYIPFIIIITGIRSYYSTGIRVTPFTFFRHGDGTYGQDISLKKKRTRSVRLWSPPASRIKVLYVLDLFTRRADGQSGRGYFVSQHATIPYYEFRFVIHSGSPF